MIDINAAHAWIDLPIRGTNSRPRLNTPNWTPPRLTVHVYVRDNSGPFALIEPVDGGGQQWVRRERLRSTPEPLPPPPLRPNDYLHRIGEIKARGGWKRKSKEQPKTPPDQANQGAERGGEQEPEQSGRIE